MLDLPIALHIPDGFLSGGVAAVCGVLAIAWLRQSYSQCAAVLHRSGISPRRNGVRG